MLGRFCFTEQKNVDKLQQQRFHYHQCVHNKLTGCWNSLVTNEFINIPMFTAHLRMCYSKAHQTSSCTTGTGTTSHDHLWKPKIISSAGEQHSWGYCNISTIQAAVSKHHSFNNLTTMSTAEPTRQQMVLATVQIIKFLDNSTPTVVGNYAHQITPFSLCYC